MIWFIVNRASGNGKGHKVWKYVERLLIEKNIKYQVAFTERPRHAIEIAKSISKQNGTNVVIAIGGDGTVHEVANGLVGSEIPLGSIPAGSGNDFARGLQVPKQSNKALEKALYGKKRKIDIVSINDEVFINAAGMGFDGQVAKVTNQAKYKKWLNHLGLGKFCYVVSFFKVLFLYRATEVSIVIDDKEQTFSDVWLIAVANIPFYGGGMMICPNAKCDDGVFDVCIVHGISRWKLVKLLPRVFRGTHIFNRAITTLTGKQLTIMSTSPMITHGDGEIVGETPIQLTIKKEGLYIV
ncbi:diacylglycerol kinase family protein [Brevibacillus laterosporus]|uniref:Diacylglycerol kinase family lipid kinase n=1 Tax=Brevibacillus halotolerans TaxID=1507437 RepID=A0ABT4HUB6_9BACL|nr:MULTISPECIES: diacylglycerol kinase family protein [Brevibacillus]MCR8984638.1 diacylglycerol kinase family lipid kinase [Brevibacillus laterosporus]MCZ0830364.1 diacylglycerol kinase family lipid kinase [Brevibacillus halotolerans]GIN99480.1 diacylglycerol kinase [Brevibacillus halotolerans]